ncbi:MAG: DALR domain-containing protein, partial [Desulfatitalea sp.]
PSPWGPGRPGWHIECSAMSTGLLGEVFDIHGGGTDLIFPHHENEIAQSESIFGKNPANFWMHNGLVHIHGEKMSKSLGNSLKLNDLLDIYPPDVLRLFLLSKRYGHPMEFLHHSIHTAGKSLARLHRFFSCFSEPATAPTITGMHQGSLWARFCSAMDDDFNFPMALSVVFEGVRRINRQLGIDSNPSSVEDSGVLKTTISDLAFMCREILGFNFEPIAEAMPGLPWKTRVGHRDGFERLEI